MFKSLARKLFFAFFLLANFLSAQAMFVNRNDLLSHNTNSGVAMATADMDKDDLEDIVRIASGLSAFIEYQQPNGSLAAVG